MLSQCFLSQESYSSVACQVTGEYEESERLLFRVVGLAKTSMSKNGIVMENMERLRWPKDTIPSLSSIIDLHNSHRKSGQEVPDNCWFSPIWSVFGGVWFLVEGNIGLYGSRAFQHSPNSSSTLRSSCSHILCAT